jgi:hypothetical protein
MTILFFADNGDMSLNDYLFNFIKSRSGFSIMEAVQTIESLKNRLRRLPKGIDIAILIAKDREQLREFVSMKDFLDGVSIILILPDQDRETISQATKLYPSFISFIDSDFSLVSDVLGNMLNRKEKRYTAERI